VLAEAENRLFCWGGDRNGTDGFSVVAFVALKAGELKELDGTGLAPNGFRLGPDDRSVVLDETNGVEGRDDVCVTGGGEIVGVDRGSSLEKILPQTSSSSHSFDDPLITVSCFTVAPSARPTRFSKLTSPPTVLETAPETGTEDLSSKR